MATLPNATEFTDGALTEGDFKTAIAQQRDFLAGLLGNDGTPASARAALGVPAVADVASAVPVGAVFMFAATTAPAGYMKCNGAILNRGTYAALFAAIGTFFGAGDGSSTFALPDLRGEFVRGWDDARGVDAGRGFGTAQGSANLSHTHTGTAESAGAHAHTIPYDSTSGNATGFGRATGSNSGYPTSTAGAHSHSLSVAATGGTESRPRNIALLYCIKY